MASALVLCADIMTASRFSAPGHEVTVARSMEQARARLRASPVAVLVIDLTAFPAGAGDLRESAGGATVVGFAPHVREDLLGPAAETCDVVLPRGAVARRLPHLLEQA